MTKNVFFLFLVFMLCGCNSQTNEFGNLKKENREFKNEIQQKTEIMELKQKYIEAMNKMHLIASGIDSYITDWNKPPDGSSLKELANNSKFVPFYVPGSNFIDPWGREFYFVQIIDGNHRRVWIGCAGSDGIFKGFEQEGETIFRPGIDIVLYNGSFKFAPQDIKYE